MDDPKFKKTLQHLVIAALISSLIGWLGSWIGGFFTYNVGFFGIIYVLVGAVIGGAIGALLMYYFYVPVRDWIKKSFLKPYIRSLFELYWRPALVGYVIGALIGLPAIFTASKYLGVAGAYASALGVNVPGTGSLFLSWIIVLAADIIGVYIAAKYVANNLKKEYPW